MPLPSSPGLVSRMCRQILQHTPAHEHDSLRTFFIEESALDCAQLFRQPVGEYGMSLPASYAVQGRRNSIKERYLRSLDVNTIWLDGWNSLPDFLHRINPARDSQRSVGRMTLRINLSRWPRGRTWQE
jgi:hypothetical protein